MCRKVTDLQLMWYEHVSYRMEEGGLKNVKVLGKTCNHRETVGKNYKDSLAKVMVTRNFVTEIFYVTGSREVASDVKIGGKKKDHLAIK